MFVEAQAEEYESFCDRYPHVDREQVSLALTTAINRRRKRTSQVPLNGNRQTDQLIAALKLCHRSVFTLFIFKCF